MQDLASAAGVIAAAGNQLSGESMHFQKPFLAIPEKKHQEQCINAHFLKELGGGDWICIEKLQPPHIANFLDNLERFRQNLVESPYSFDGTDDALREINSFLKSKS